MPSPFPGVDPYLESQHRWQDFHARFINYWSEAISDQLPENYAAIIEEQVEILEYDVEKTQLRRPDILVAKTRDNEQGTAPATSGAAAATLEAVTIPFPVMEEVPHRWIEIVHLPNQQLVAVLELLSPSNKANPGRGQYLAKRSQIYMENVHLVELDLLLGGMRLPMGRHLPPGDFFAIVGRVSKRPNADVFAWTLRDKMPTIPIPLAGSDQDIATDLAAVFNTAYDRGHYARIVKYTADLDIPADTETLKWARQVAGKAISNV